MGKKVEYNDFVNSQYAISEYIHWQVGNDSLHKARILVFSNDKVKYNNILEVFPRIETNYSFIDIIGDEQFERDYYMEYTNEYQKFDFINGSLLIKAEDRWGNSIEIDITNF